MLVFSGQRVRLFFEGQAEFSGRAKTKSGLDAMHEGELGVMVRCYGPNWPEQDQVAVVMAGGDIVDGMALAWMADSR